MFGTAMIVVRMRVLHITSHLSYKSSNATGMDPPYVCATFDVSPPYPPLFDRLVQGPLCRPGFGESNVRPLAGTVLRHVQGAEKAGAPSLDQNVHGK